MHIDLRTLCGKLAHLFAQEDGQDLVEYALVVALIALGATVGMGALASDISSGFTSIGTSVSNAV